MHIIVKCAACIQRTKSGITASCTFVENKSKYGGGLFIEGATLEHEERKVCNLPFGVISTVGINIARKFILFLRHVRLS